MNRMDTKQLSGKSNGVTKRPGAMSTALLLIAMTFSFSAKAAEVCVNSQEDAQQAAASNADMKKLLDKDETIFRSVWDTSYNGIPIRIKIAKDGQATVFSRLSSYELKDLGFKASVSLCVEKGKYSIKIGGLSNDATKTLAGVLNAHRDGYMGSAEINDGSSSYNLSRVTK